MVEETSENLAYMYEDFGVYTLQLVALTAQGCADTSSKVIRAVDPVSNIRANSISTQRVGGLVFPTLSLTNLGNYDINQLRLEVDYGGQFSTFQTLTDELPAGASKNIALNNGIESGRYSTLSYVCIRSVGENLQLRTRRTGAADYRHAGPSRSTADRCPRRVARSVSNLDRFLRRGHTETCRGNESA